MRIWLDKTVMAKISKDQIHKILMDKHVLVASNEMVDIKIFQDDPIWVEFLIRAGHLVVESSMTFNEMTKKPYFWVSFWMETRAFQTFLEAMATLSVSVRALDIIKLATLVEKYGIPKADWAAGQLQSPAPISEEDAQALGVDSQTATHIDILKVADQKGAWDIYSHYIVEHCKSIANYHCCDAVLDIKGKIVPI